MEGVVGIKGVESLVGMDMASLWGGVGWWEVKEYMCGGRWRRREER